jgi:hypothetical protein
VKDSRALLASGALALGMVVTAAAASCASFRDDGGSASSDAGSDSVTVADGGVDGSAAGELADSGASDSSTPDGGDAAEASAPGDGGTCTQATCPTTPVLSGLYGPAALAVDTNYVYWLEVGSMIPQSGGSGQLVRLHKGTTCADRSCVEVIDPYALSGTFELIYDNQLAVGPDDVCYAQSFNAQAEHQIACFSLTSLAETVIDQGYGDCDGLWMGPGSVLFSIASTTSTSSDGSIRIRPIAATDGGAAPAVASMRPDPTSLGLGDAGGAVMVAAADGGVSPLVAQRGAPVAVAEYAGYVYWLDAQARTVLRTSRAGGGAVEQIANTDANPFALVVDPSGVYWAAAGLTNPEGSVAHAPLAPGGPTTVMMSGVVGIQALGVDATQVFVAAVGASVNGGGSIVAMDKSR